MLKAARAHGRPMIVIAMITAATSQPTAIHRPPNTIHSRLRSRLKGDIPNLQLWDTLTRLAALGTLSRGAGEGSKEFAAKSPSPAPRERGDPARRAGWVRAIQPVHQRPRSRNLRCSSKSPEVTWLSM